jgi:hypothetical protein
MKKDDEKLFWVWHQDKISLEKGFKRDSPSQPEYNGQLWWFPSLGWTLWKETHCFDSKREAVDYAQKDVMKRITVLQKLLIILENHSLEG